MALTNAERQARFRVKQASRYVTGGAVLTNKAQRQLACLSRHLGLGAVEVISEALARLEHELTRTMLPGARQAYTGAPSSTSEPLRNEPVVAVADAKLAREQLRQKALMRRHSGSRRRK